MAERGLIRSRRLPRNMLLILFAAFLAAAFQQPMPAEKPDAALVLAEMERTLFPEQYRMNLLLTTRESDGRERETQLEIWYRKGVGTYMEMLAPARSRGTRFLQKEDALWMFMPRSGGRSPVRLPARDAFQGSAFSNADIGDSSYTEDYRAEIVGEEQYDHPEAGFLDCWLIGMTPLHSEAAYGSITAWVTREGFIPLRMDYHVRSGLLSKRMLLFDIRPAAGRRRPMRMEMHSSDEEGKITIAEILELEQREDLPDRIFTRNYLIR